MTGPGRRSAAMCVPTRPGRRRHGTVLTAAVVLLALSAVAAHAGAGRASEWFTVSRSTAQAPTLPAAAPYVAGAILYRAAQPSQRLTRPLLAPLLGQDTALAIPSPGGRYLAYHAWRDRTPLLYLHDSAAGGERLLARGAQTLAWRRDGTLAYLQAATPRYQQRGGAYLGRVLVRRSLRARPAAWTPAPGGYQVLAWARNELLVAVRPCYFPNCRRDPEPGVYALAHPGQLRPLHLGALAALSPDGRYAFGRFDRWPGQDSPSPLVRVVRVRGGRPLATLDLRQRLLRAGLRGRLPGSLLGAAWRGDEIVGSISGRDSALVFLRFRRGRLTLESVARIPARTLPGRWGTSFGVPAFASGGTEKVIVPIRASSSDNRPLVAVLACSRPARSCLRGRILPPRAWFALAANPSRPAAARAASPYPIVAQVAGVPVRAPTARTAWGACPSDAVPVGNAGMRQAKAAVLAALPTIARQIQPPLKLRGARVVGLTHTRRAGFILPDRRSCWGLPFARSILVQLFLPAERAAPDLRGNPWFYIARTSTSWVIWDEPH